MGRTKRKRCVVKPRNFYLSDDNEDSVLLNTWLAKNGLRRNKKLALAVFDDTGRGVITKKKIKCGEELITLPLNLTINVSTLLMDKAFCSIFLDNSVDCLREYKQGVSFQSLMSFYLAFLRVLSVNSKWHVYLESLPKDYTVPYFLPYETQCNIDTDILSIIIKQKDTIESSYKIFRDILKTSSKESSVHILKSFTLPLYEWAYFTVNTRCVYMDLSKVIDLKNIENTILNLICDNTKISLCPYLDMINHSPDARNETKLLVSRDIENLNIKDLNEDLFLDISFSIYTKNNFDPYSQVFICYGDSHNLKLITEYGFYLPDNELDCVSFNFDNIKSYFTTNSIKLSQEQANFISNHSLNKDLYIDNKGLSFNLYGLLMVVKYYYRKDMDVSRLIYSAAICSNDRNLNELIMPLVMNKLKEISDSINILRSTENRCVILDNCIALMCQYVCILEKFIKC
ncbi:SET domain-containing protein 4 [Manduca sexta]|uniref:SET domain-containing protein n=1 Tax=Manduca sexta TaxID=7130 RepID=A0A922CXK1_MANSE|nr:SET domain-containing protein 4 [Manduca sexta]KAG6461977.1 hypothetical protein O3G_MSEX012970 [Manduca sexta]